MPDHNLPDNRFIAVAAGAGVVVAGIISIILWFYIRNWRRPRCRYGENLSTGEYGPPSRRMSWIPRERSPEYWSADDIGRGKRLRSSSMFRRHDKRQSNRSNVVVLPTPDVLRWPLDRESKVVVLPEPDVVKEVEHVDPDQKSGTLAGWPLPKDDEIRPISRRVRTLSTHISLQVMEMAKTSPKRSYSTREYYQPGKSRSSYDDSVVVNLDWQHYR